MPINDAERLHQIVMKQVQRRGKQIAEKAGEQVLTKGIVKRAAGQFSLVTAFTDMVDSSQKECLDETRKHEGCPHIDLITGLGEGGAFTHMILYLNETVGVAWQNGDGNSAWYFHPSISFGPDMIRGYLSLQGQAVKPITDNGNGDCVICERIREARTMRNTR